jgi:hypothetical protein
MLFDIIDHRDGEILHRNVTLAPGIAEQLIAAESKVSRALTGNEVRGRRKKGPVETGLRHESFEIPRAGRCFGLKRLREAVRIQQRLARRDFEASDSADNEKPF